MNTTGYDALPNDLKEALKRCDILAGVDQLELFYNLYDPKTGGFYHTISSRDTEGMTPFGEATYFVLEALRAGGITLPDWYKKKVGNWVLNHQDEGDGFFYEELWGKITSGGRLHRDLSYNNGILEMCDIKPKYPLPAERIKNRAENEEIASIPDYLSSKEALIAHLDSLPWDSAHIWGTCGNLASARSLITAAGLRYTVTEYAIKKQNPETALWGEGLSWMNTNGAMKISGFFDEEHPFPMVDKVIDSFIKLYTGDIPPSSATWIWNPFVMLNAVIGTHKKDAGKIRELLYERGAEIVNCAVDNALKLKKADGGFASSPSGAIGYVQGYLMGLGLPDESDIDGTLIAGYRLRNSIHYAFGIQPDKTYYAKYNDEFWEKCKNKAPVSKIYPRPDKPIKR
ncbi:MAG: hypothetical protein IJY69_04060 [Clostridia bacterium]|nr:hypothetical protein [Clostridia bacterium]